MNNTDYRPLLPATRPRSPPGRPLPKKKRISIACDICRTKRTRCDGNRPVCTACIGRGSNCIYTSHDDQGMRPVVLQRENAELRAQVAAFHDIVDLLKSMPADAAQHSLHHVLTRSDPVTMLKALRGESIGAVISEQDTVRAFFPAVHSKCELELLFRHPIAYPPVDFSSRAESLRLHLSSLYSPWSTPVLQSQSASISAESSSVEHPEHVERTEDSSDSTHLYFDPRLAQLKIDFWTSAPISNTYAAKVISSYLEIQHFVWGIFDPWLFLRDLIELRFDFCSSFMVNSLLAIALVGTTCYLRGGT
jgi:hypothetical protein